MVRMKQLHVLQQQLKTQSSYLQYHIIYLKRMQAEPDTSLVIFDDTERIVKCKNKPQLINLNQIYQNDSGSHCGYCDKDDTSYSWSFTKDKMDPFTYQLLMERGWRRCGTYYYKPNLQKSCCKLFTHRLQVEKYKPKKDQKKALKRVITIAYEKIEEMKNEDNPKGKKEKQNQKQKAKQKQVKVQNTQLITEDIKNELTLVCEKITQFLKKQLPRLIKQFPLTEALFQKFKFDLSNKLKFFKANQGEKSDYYSNYVQLIFGLNKKLFGQSKYSLTDFSKQVKTSIQSLGIIGNFHLQVERGGYLLFKRTEKTHEFEILEEKKEEIKEQKMHIQSLQVKQSNAKQEEKGIMGFFQTIKKKFKGQHQIEGRSSEKIPESIKLKDKDSNKFQVLKPQNQYKGQINITFNKITFGKIEINIVPAEQNVQSFKLYQNYSKDIHEKSEKSMSSYVNFLCLQALQFRNEKSLTPIESRPHYIPAWDPQSKHQQPKPITGDVVKRLGCYHMKYYYEGKLIGVSVVDFVDEGLSAVYFFYDPSFKEYRLGVFSSLIEIEYVRWLRLSFPQFRHYYMGFYISNCEKMNYKADYSPCQLLCPITYRFIDFSEEIKLLTDKVAEGKQKNFRLAPSNEKPTDDMTFGKDIGPYIDKNIKILYNKKRLVLKEINPHFYLHILKIINLNLPVWGKKIFDIWTFTL